MAKVVHIDASRALDVHPTGVNVYAKEIIDHLPVALPDTRFVLYAPEWLASRAEIVFPKLPTNCEWKFLSWPPKYLWTQVCLAYAWARADKQDAVFFAPAHVAPLFSPHNTLVTVHDVAFDMVPRAYSFFERMFARLLTRANVRAATHIFTPSHETERQLVKQYRVAEQKITVTPLALPCGVREAATPEEIKAVKKKFFISRPFVLFVGRIEYKKGVDMLVHAWHMVQATHDLVLAGKPGVGYEKIKPLLSEARIHELGFVDDTDVRALYDAADMYVIPSRYEGFGINALEAFTHGVPVVAAGTGAIPEVVDSAALLAHTEIEMGEHMLRLASDPLLKSHLIAEGKERSTMFSWEKTVDAMRSYFA